MLAVAMLAIASPICESSGDTGVDANTLTLNSNCLPKCYPHKPHCTHRYHPKPAWKCCKYHKVQDVDDEFGEIESNMLTSNSHCLPKCYLHKPHCPHGFHPKKAWKCCKHHHKAQDDVDEEFDEFDDEF